jgi:hypothetical protein
MILLEVLLLPPLPLLLLLLLLLLLKNLFVGRWSHAGAKLQCHTPATSTILFDCHYILFFIYLLSPLE